eukprot:1324851-Pyramimonas_sp.AAC.1
MHHCIAASKQCDAIAGREPQDGRRCPKERLQDGRRLAEDCSKTEPETLRTVHGPEPKTGPGDGRRGPQVGPRMSPGTFLGASRRAQEGSKRA